jgi:hypothetical protein
MRQLRGHLLSQLGHSSGLLRLLHSHPPGQRLNGGTAKPDGADGVSDSHGRIHPTPTWRAVTAASAGTPHLL